MFLAQPVIKKEATKCEKKQCILNATMVWADAAHASSFYVKKLRSKRRFFQLSELSPNIAIASSADGVRIVETTATT